MRPPAALHLARRTGPSHLRQLRRSGCRRDTAVVAGVDVGVVGVDAGVLGVLAGVDAGVLAGVDAGVLAGVLAGVDAGVLAGLDVWVVAGVDADMPVGVDEPWNDDALDEEDALREADWEADTPGAPRPPAADAAIRPPITHASTNRRRGRLLAGGGG